MRSNQSGYTLFEVLFTLSLSSILLSMSAYNLRELNRTLHTGSSQVQGFLKQARTKAIATTSAYVVYTHDQHTIHTSYKTSCSSFNETFDSKLQLELPTGIEFQNPGWSVCFNARGLADDNVLITLVNSNNETSDVEVLLGGAVRKSE